MDKTPTVRIAASNEKTLEYCIQRSVWATRAKLPRDWQTGDTLLVRVDNSLAAVGLVRSKLLQDEPEAIHPSFPLVAKLDWIWTANHIGERVPFGEFKKELRSAWGAHYGFRLLNQNGLPPKQSRRVLALLAERIPAVKKLM